MKSSECKNFLENWDDTDIGTSTSACREDILAHLNSCADCQKIYRSFEQVSISIDHLEISQLSKRRIEIAARNLKRPNKKVGLPANQLAIALAACFAGIVIGAFLLWATQSKTVPEVRTVSNVEDSRDNWDPSEVDSRLMTPQFQSLGDGRTVVQIGPKTALWLEEGAAVEVVTLEPGIAQFFLKQGRVVGQVNPDGSFKRFVVRTPGGEIEARGTLFSVEVKPNGQEIARVAKGVVEVRSAQSIENYLLFAGNETVIGVTGPLAANIKLLENDLCLVEGCSVSHTKDDTLVRGTTNNKKPNKNQTFKNATDEKQKLAYAAIKERRLNEAASLVDGVLKNRPNAKVTIDLLNKLARAYRQNRDFSEAKKTYLRLINRFPGYEASDNGLVALAQIEQTALNDRQSALNHYDLYLKNRPNGYLAETALVGKVRVLSVMGNSNKAITTANTYLKRYPTGISAAEMVRRRADIYFRLGNRNMALKDYTAVLKRWPGTIEAKRAQKRLSSLGM